MRSYTCKNCFDGYAFKYQTQGWTDVNFWVQVSKKFWKEIGSLFPCGVYYINSLLQGIHWLPLGQDGLFFSFLSWCINCLIGIFLFDFCSVPLMTSQLEIGHMSRQDAKAQCWNAPGATGSKLIAEWIARFRTRKNSPPNPSGTLIGFFACFVVFLCTEGHSLCPRYLMQIKKKSFYTGIYSISNIFYSSCLLSVGHYRFFLKIIFCSCCLSQIKLWDYYSRKQGV